MTLSLAKRHFLHYLNTERGRSAKTLENYNRCLTVFLHQVKVTEPAKLSEEHVRLFRAWLQKQPGTKVGTQVELITPQTQNYYAIVIRSFLKFLQDRRISSLDPTKITLEKIPHSQFDLITSAELKRLLLSPNVMTTTGLRDRALLEVIVSTGVRISELCSLSRSDVHLKRGILQVSGKGGDIREAALSPGALKVLTAYLKRRTDTCSALFIQYGKNANATPDLRLSPRSIQRMVKLHSTNSGITREVTPHLLRHRYAIDLLSQGVSNERAQKFLGHKNAVTLKMYSRQRETEGL